MAPAIKRRKIKHDNGSDESEANFLEETKDEELSSEDSEASNVSMDAPEERDDDEEASNGEPEEQDNMSEPVLRCAPATVSKTDNTAKAHKRQDVQPRDGVFTAESFKNNVFKLQVNELLDQVKLKHGKKEASAEKAMRMLKSLIEHLPSRAPASIAEAEKTLESAGVAIPFPSPRPPKDAKYKLQYERPSSINATGSYPLKTATRTDGGVVIDLVVVMPKAIFQEKDYLNFRYFYKRAYYLACLAAGIKASKEHSFKVSFDTLNGNHLQPVIVIDPSGSGFPDSSGSSCRINILPIVSEETFPGAKLLPKSNCVRPKGEDDDGPATKPLAPTPFYNSTLRSDATVTSYLKLLHAVSEKCDAFKDACILGRIWLRQRGFGSSLRKGGFGNFEWAAITALLLQPSPRPGTAPLSPGYSSYQLFKATVQFLARNDLCKKPFTLQSRDVDFPKSSGAPVFFDGPRGLNILFKMTIRSYSQLQFEAKTTVDALGDSVFDQFDSTFILRTDLLRYRYDATLGLPLSAFEFDPKSDDYNGKLGEACNKIYSTLIRALTDRVTTVTFTLPDSGAWPISTPKPPESQQKHILINFAIDPANAHRTIDYGPAAENKQEAASFRKFWGDKAELRRFKDGSILESVVWSNKDTTATILEQISLHVLGRHVDSQIAENAEFVNDSFAPLIASGRIQGQSGIASFSLAMNAFTSIEKDIRELEGLPLQIRHIRAADEQLRYASINLPLSRPASIVLQFEASARWPDDLCAIQRTKTAFLLKIAELLSAAHSGVATRVGLENPSQPSHNQAYLDITVRTGFTFRLRIYHDREATLLERQLKDKSLDVHSHESSATALALYKREFIQVLSHTQAIQNLCTRYPALSPAIRLTKKWFACHLMLPHFAPELVELLVVRTFLQPHPWPTPSCATTGFLRTLAWIARWDWRHVPLVVDFSSSMPSNSAESESYGKGTMKLEDMEQVQTRFEAWRQIDPVMNRVVLFAATNIDTSGNTWTDMGRPEKVVAARMTALAKAATTVIRAQEDHIMAAANGKETATADLPPESLFISQIRDYDLVIHISSKYSRVSKDKKSEPKYKNLEIQLIPKGSLGAETDLVPLFVEDLQNVFGDAVLWFWDPESLDRIAGLWNPLVSRQRAFKVKAGWNSAPVRSRDGEPKGMNEKSVGIHINKRAVLNDIKRLGGDLVSRIDVNRSCIGDRMYSK
ncbi:pre-rRNA processing protein-like protein Utp22 [Lentithecium fluviatile CBS 122367]|uniref:U3 small nucleolar RNA-associated protein 22 n=1 Tax=Lentithecium fluviatile CBS 122367 TaxID=1168545 RepID=A0A6G1J6P3_9PLEO|nr:pre-rRNA processing protein-like protein Utp22 [Lentithecium fluviatile CBS 122367]